MDIGTRVLAIIAAQASEQRVTLAELADVIGVTLLDIASLRLGRCAITREQVARACEYLEIDLVEAFTLPGAADAR